ncbi:MAG TPA: HlyD family secretion protein [bacterium]|jgi:membrane fusion protein (multidrug efflux system)
MDQESRKDQTFVAQTNGAEANPADANGRSQRDDANNGKSGSFARRLKVIIPVVIVLGAIGLFAWRWYLGNRDYVSTDDAAVDADRVSVSSKVLGRIVQLNADEGDSVTAGQILVQLDASDLRAQQAQAHTSLDLAQENIRLARVNVSKAEQDYRRAQAQFKDNVIPAETLDHAQKEYEASQARLAIAEAQVGTSRAQISVVDTSLRNTTITAPMTGVVSKRWVLPGDVVQPAQPILTLYNLRDVWITANLEETKLRSLKLGDNVEVHIDAYPSLQFTGHVTQFGTNTAAQFSLIPPNNASGNFTKVTQRVPVKIRLEQIPVTDGRPVQLLPGMSAEVKVKVRSQ